MTNNTIEIRSIFLKKKYFWAPTLNQSLSWSTLHALSSLNLVTTVINIPTSYQYKETKA